LVAAVVECDFDIELDVDIELGFDIHVLAPTPN
jgi:hypothetical protein